MSDDQQPRLRLVHSSPVHLAPARGPNAPLTWGDILGEIRGNVVDGDIDAAIAHLDDLIQAVGDREVPEHDQE